MTNTFQLKSVVTYSHSTALNYEPKGSGEIRFSGNGKIYRQVFYDANNNGKLDSEDKKISFHSKRGSVKDHARIHNVTKEDIVKFGPEADKYFKLGQGQRKILQASEELNGTQTQELQKGSCTVFINGPKHTHSVPVHFNPPLSLKTVLSASSKEAPPADSTVPIDPANCNTASAYRVPLISIAGTFGKMNIEMEMNDYTYDSIFGFRELLGLKNRINGLDAEYTLLEGVLMTHIDLDK